MRTLILVSTALLISSFPLSAQRGRAATNNGRPVRAGVEVRTDFGAFAVTNRGVAFRSPAVRRAVTLRALRYERPRAFQRLLRDHERLHREMHRMNRGRARHAHARWHDDVGFVHGDFVRLERQRSREHREW